MDRILVAILLIFVPSMCEADNVVLTDGTVLHGTIIAVELTTNSNGQQSRMYTLRTEDGVTVEIPASRIMKLQIEEEPRAKPGVPHPVTDGASSEHNPAFLAGLAAGAATFLILHANNEETDRYSTEGRYLGNVFLPGRRREEKHERWSSDRNLLVSGGAALAIGVLVGNSTSKSRSGQLSHHENRAPMILPFGAGLVVAYPFWNLGDDLVDLLLTDKLDQLTVGQFSRSQVMRIVLQDFLQKSEREQRKFLTSKAFNWLRYPHP